MTETIRSPHRRLDPHLRTILAALVADRPGDSAARIAMTFEARTGRKIDRRTVRYLRVAGGYKEHPANGHLSPAEREILSLLILEGGSRRPTSCRQVAEQFAALTGRVLYPASVWDHRVKVLGLPRVRAGRGPKPRRKEAS